MDRVSLRRVAALWLVLVLAAILPCRAVEAAGVVQPAPGVEVRESPGAGAGVGLALRSDPAGATFFLGSRSLGTAPVEEVVDPGAGLFTVTLADCAPTTFQLDLQAGRHYDVMVHMVRNRGALEVRTGVGGAVVQVAGRELVTRREDGGVALFDVLPVGEHEVKVTEPSHLPWTGRIRVETNRTARLDAALTLRPARLAVESTPPGAKVRLDGREVGTTPLSGLEVPPGSHALVLSLTPYQDDKVTVDLGVGESRTLRRDLVERKGRLLLRVEPAQATARLVEGPAPTRTNGGFAFDGLAPGDYLLTVEATDHRTFTAVVQVGRDPLEAKLALDPIPARVLVTTNPLGAEVWLDGKRQPGATPAALEILPGQVRIQVKMAGYREDEDVLEILPNKEYKVDFELEAR